MNDKDESKAVSALVEDSSHENESKDSQNLMESEVDDFEDPAILKALEVAARDAADGTEEEPNHESQPNDERDKYQSHETEATHISSEMDDLEDPVVRKIVWMRASGAEAEPSEAPEHDTEFSKVDENGPHEKLKLDNATDPEKVKALTEGKQNAAMVNGGSFLVDSASGKEMALPPGPNHQSEVERGQDERPGADVIDHDGTQPGITPDSNSGYDEVPPSSTALRRQSEADIAIAEQVVVDEEIELSERQEIEAQVLTMMINEAVQADVVEDASKEEESDRWKELSRSKVFCRSKVFWVLVCIVLVGVVAASISIGVFAGGRSGEGSTVIVGLVPTLAPSRSASPSMAPSRSASPSIAVVDFNVNSCGEFEGFGYKLFDEDPRVYKQEYLLVREALRSNLTRFNVQSLRDDTCSPANLAIWWLASEYNLTSSPLPLPVRFGLAVLFFSVKAGTSAATAGWFRRNSSDCTWTGIGCQDGFVVNMTAPQASLRGSLPTEIGLLSNLENVDFSYNFIAGPLPSEIWQLSKLTSLDLFRGTYEGTLPSEFGGLTELELLNLGATSLSGTIPTEYGDLTRLTQLTLRNNNVLQGSIPSELGRLTRLQILRISSCALTGTIPLEILSLPRLCEYCTRHCGTRRIVLTILTVDIWLSDNELDGTIPTEFGSLTRLRRIRLNTNFLTGTLPSEIANLRRLQSLDVSENFNLGGTFPPQYEALANLAIMYLNGTNVTGTIPFRLCLQNTFIEADCALRCACCVGC